MQEIEFEDRSSKWWGYGDYYCVSPNGTKILLPYKSEPPHGDSYHNLIINSKTLKGYIWCGYFLWSECGKYFTCDWLEGMGGHRDGATWVFTQISRATIVVAPEELLYRVVLNPTYSEMHSILREKNQKHLWKILLNEGNSSWEEFF